MSCWEDDEAGSELCKAMRFPCRYSLDYARTRLANDAKSGSKGGERQFNGLIDVYRCVAQEP